MFKFIWSIVKFRMGQKAAKKTARAIGLKWLSKPVGLIGGLKAVR